jgi:hypothetical protein
MNPFERYQRTMFGLIAALTVAIAAVLLVLLPEAPGWGLGFLLGGAGGLGSYRLRVHGLLRLPHLPQDQWQKAALKTNLQAYGLLIGTAVAAIVLDGYVVPGWVNPYGALAGLVLERAVLLADGMLRPGALSDADEAANGGEAEGQA